MFHERADGDAVKREFLARYGIPVSMKADIGDHIEYYYLDTEARFGCLIESGSGHAIDFVRPAQVYPSEDAVFGPSPLTGLTCPITQVSIVVRDLDARLAAYEEAFGWGPWRRFDGRAGGAGGGGGGPVRMPDPRRAGRRLRRPVRPGPGRRPQRRAHRAARRPATRGRRSSTPTARGSRRSR